jgi:hypothetical protein
VKAALSSNPDEVRLDWHEAMGASAASRYTATTPALLRSFKHYNSGRESSAQVRPFNFMLWFYAKDPKQLVIDGHDIDWTKRSRKPKPAAPYDKDPRKAARKAFDRVTGEPIGAEWLETYQRLLRTYAHHPETKFLPAERAFSGPLQRRHVHVAAIHFIGKEADRWEEDEQFGADEDSLIEYDLSADARRQAAETIRRALEVCTHLELARAARVSKHTVRRAMGRDPSVDNQALGRLVRAAGQLSRAYTSGREVGLMRVAGLAEV